jgi:hypothetical protein
MANKGPEKGYFPNVERRKKRGSKWMEDGACLTTFSTVQIVQLRMTP